MRIQRVLPIRFCLLAAVVVSATTPLLAENWPQWRGPRSGGISTEKDLPAEWSTEKNVAWRLELPGAAGATPAIWGDRIFLTSVDGDDLILMCVSTAGKELWRRTVGRGNTNVRGDEGNSASPSPTTDGRHVWATFSNGAMGCYTVDGDEVWKLHLPDRYGRRGRFDIQFGMSSTPVLSGDRLFLQLIHGDGRPETQEAVVVALDKLTGREVWKSDRVTGAANENEHSYASPVLYDDGRLKLLITHGADYVVAYDLEDGSEVWRCGGLNPQDDPDKPYHTTLRFVASPSAAPGIVVVPTAKREKVIAIRPGLHGDLTGNRSALLWELPENTPDVPSPLIHDGLVYLCRENGNFLCLDAETGEPVYGGRDGVRTHRVRHRASPVYADGKIYLAGRDGRVTVVRAGREFEILAQNDMGESISASPAISGGTIYLRTYEALWAIRQDR